MQFYNATSRIFPRHYAARMFALSFSAVHIPLVTFLAIQALRGEWAWDLFLALLIATVSGSAIAIIGIAGMLRPVEVATQVMRALRDGRPTARIPVGGPDMAGELLETVAHAVRTTAERMEALEDLADTDMLTGLFNRRGMYGEIARLGHPGGVLVVFDCNGFKEVNDRLGHAAGDHVLRAMGDRLIRFAGTVAVLTRWGGDEFLAFFPDTTEEAISGRIARIERSLLSNPLSGPGEKPVTFAIGYAMARDGTREAIETAVKLADRSMYDDKRERRALSAA